MQKITRIAADSRLKRRTQPPAAQLLGSSVRAARTAFLSSSSRIPGVLHAQTVTRSIQAGRSVARVCLSVCLCLSPSLSRALTHAHTHTHTGRWSASRGGRATMGQADWQGQDRGSLHERRLHEHLDQRYPRRAEHLQQHCNGNGRVDRRRSWGGCRWGVAYGVGALARLHICDI